MLGQGALLFAYYFGKNFAKNAKSLYPLTEQFIMLKKQHILHEPPAPT